ncbi:DUF2177 family protein [Acidovorax sp. NCPPB 3576]|uniref:DUF2177 family protein n=1 Tax=Acidovorax sp. NCPPB 3576 TaxID=2940488 RepID=UPI00234A1A09|nr:DUF2177 family protein [Acidovorax sp. NCPPB 3576]WCM87239.1 DUF2177 family protein [Acidovorax sp. NCPPB 3576]
MMIRPLAVAYASTALVFLALDAVWLSTMADRLYRPGIGHLMQDKFSVAPAALFYLIYVAGVVVMAVLPAVEQRSWVSALGMGALLGFIAYATYDLTNQATLKDWPWSVTIADMCWGAFVTGAAATAACLATLRWGGPLR